MGSRAGRRGSALPSRILLTVGLLVAACTARAEERSVTVLQGRKITVEVPKGWTFGDSRDPKTGLQALRWQDPSGEVRLDLLFYPDTNGWVSTREGLDAEMEKIFAFYRGGAVEKEKKAVDLKPVTGIGAYMSFTDGSLVGKTLPAGEYRISTTGIRSWSKAYCVFTLLSNAREGGTYRRALEILRSGMKEAAR